MRFSIICASVAVAVSLVSCSTPKKIVYFQDLDNGSVSELSPIKEIRVKPQDKISIVVNSKDPQLADLFNLPIVSHRVGYGQTGNLNTSQQVSSYSVDSEGMIDFPILGRLKIDGMRREEIAAFIKNELIKNNLVNDPVVTVEFANLHVSVLGEVAHPGQYSINHDKLTILDALGMAGDLTIYGNRDNVTVLREEDGVQTAYKVDLTSASNLCNSPVFYLQQRDVVYVSPNDTRARQSTVNGNNVRSTSFWISVASLLSSIIIILIR